MKEKTIHEFFGILMDSEEEVKFAYWLDALKIADYINEWRYITNPVMITGSLIKSYVKTTHLITKTKFEKKNFTVLSPLNYTPDFAIDWTRKGFKRFVSSVRTKESNFDPKKYFFSDSNGTSIVEVKPNFDMHGKISRFSIIQKILWEFKGIFVDLIILDDLFKDTFIPLEIAEHYKYKVVPKKAAAKGKKKGDWKMDYIPKTPNEFLNGN
jgi:hypothetical protein